MVASSKTPFVADETASSLLLSIKPNQNLSLNHDSSKYDAVHQPFIECLRHAINNGRACSIGISESGSLLKQGGEVQKPAFGGFDENETTMSPPTPKDLNVNVASRSRGKGNLIVGDDDDDEEEEDLSKEAQLKRKKRDQELNGNQRVAREVEAQERELMMLN
ncbi:unnamed protein product [Lactuca saligna]|uniref:Uncharacterized protein n=1 Tax=Lactuca saligna TaxID=75948 RepID=A0AA35ZWN4_LACSI|nr:unnamed protein product [Lactuca saligna]